MSNFSRCKALGLMEWIVITSGPLQIDLLLYRNRQVMAWSCKGIKTIYHFRQICCHNAFVCMELLYSNKRFKEL